MTRTLWALAAGLIAASVASADGVTYTFEDANRDEVFNVSVQVESGATFGLATYNLQLQGLVAAGIDATQISFSEATLADGAIGFSNGLLQGVVPDTVPANDAFGAFNSQFANLDAVFGVGQSAVSSGSLSFGVPTVLGTLSIPGAGGLSDLALEALLAPTAALFSSATDPENDLVEAATSVTVVLDRAIDGDFDGDGDVDGVDLGVFAFDFANSPQPGPPFAQADFDEDGDVDGVDLGVFAFNFANFPPAPTAIPEPTTIVLVAFGVLGSAIGRQ